MSKENRKRMYDQLVAENRLSQDDGSLVKEFGEPKKQPKGKPIDHTKEFLKEKKPEV